MKILYIQISFFMLICFFLNMHSYGQLKTIGTPYIKNYSIDDYQGKDFSASTQNWDIFQDEKGIMYFANTNGILIFDGKHWKLINSDHNPTIRSVQGGKDKKIYAGAKRQLGYISNSKAGSLKFQSLLPLINEKEKNFNDVWNVYSVDNQIIFETSKKLFVYNGTQINSVPAKGQFTSSFKKNGSLFLFDSEAGLVKFSNGKLKKISNHKIFKSYGFCININDENSIIVSRNYGFYKLKYRKLKKWNIKNEMEITSQRPYCGVAIDEKHIAIGTQVGGIFILDTAGNVVQIFNKKNGLQANTVYKLYIDKKKNLWAALGNGISYFKINSPFSYFRPTLGIPKKNYNVQITGNSLYFGNEVGMHIKSISPISKDLTVNNFSLVKNSGGQCIATLMHGESVLAAHNTGILLFRNRQIISRLPTAPHIWEIMRLETFDNTYLAISNEGLFTFKVENNKLTGKHHIKGYNEPIRYAALENDYTIWITDNIDGVKKLKLKKDLKAVESVTHFTQKHGLPQNPLNRPAKVNGKIYIATIQGIYRPKGTLMVPAKDMGKAAVEGNTNLLASDRWGRIWMQTDAQLKLIENRQVLIKPFKRFKGLDLSRISVISKNNVFFSGNKYVIHYNPDIQLPVDTNFNVQINRIIDLTNDSLMLDGYKHLFHDSIASPVFKNNKLILPFKSNDIRFEYAASYYELPGKTQYQVWLEGFDNNNMGWTHETKKDYTNLPAGEYILHVKAKNVYGEISSENEFSFTILPPWYRTSLAYIFYTLVTVVLLILIIRIYTSRLKKNNIKLEKIVKERTQEIETQKEEILTQSEQLEEYNRELKKLSVVASETDNAIIIMNPEGKIEWVNKGFTNIYGYKFHEVKGKSRTDLLVDNIRDNIKEIYAKVRTTKSSSTYESKVSAKSGKLLQTNTTLTPVMNIYGEIDKIIAIDSDITKLKQAENEILQQKEEILTQNDEIQRKNEELSKHRHHLEELVKERTRDLESALKKAKESDRLKSSFLANMSHEIRTPMNAIIGYASLLEEEDDPANYINHTQMIINNSNSLLELVNNIIELSRFESETVELENETFIIDELLKTVYQSFLSQCKKKNIQLSIKKDSNKDLEVCYDRRRIAHVLEQLLQNALKYTDEGEITIGLKKNFDEHTGQIMVYVSDTGIGMKKEYADKVFDQFMKIEGNQEKLYRGTGIGLALCKRIIDKHNGKISIDSEENIGTTVFITLPKTKSR